MHSIMFSSSSAPQKNRRNNQMAEIDCNSRESLVLFWLFEWDFSMLASIILMHVITLSVEQSRNPPLKLANPRFSPTSEFTISRTKTDLSSS